MAFAFKGSSVASKVGLSGCPDGYCFYSNSAGANLVGEGSRLDTNLTCNGCWAGCDSNGNCAAYKYVLTQRADVPVSTLCSGQLATTSAPAPTPAPTPAPVTTPTTTPTPVAPAPIGNGEC